MPEPCIKREDEIQKIAQAFDQNPNHRVALSGLGGVGKTTLAASYVHTYQDRYEFVFFVEASEMANLNRAFLKLAEGLKIGGEGEEQILVNLKIFLQRRETPYLLAFDGVDTREMLATLYEYLPETSLAHILIATRLKYDVSDKGFILIKLCAFTEDEGVDYFLASTKRNGKEKNDAKKLSTRLGHLPLALKHAAGYITAKNMSFKGYAQYFEEHHFKLFGKTELECLGLSSQNSILTTWNISIEAITQAYPTEGG